MRGIVIVAGGDRYFLNAYINIKSLREHLKCNLPIEVFYLGDFDLSKKRRDILETFKDVKCINIGELNPENTICTKENGGWQAKTYSLLKSAFTEILFLDADSFPRFNPESLFELESYQKYGNLFFKDKEGFELTTDFFQKNKEFLGFDFNFTIDCLDSGQFLINKDKCLQSLIYANEFNLNPATYEIMYGDKDTFILGFIKAKQFINLNDTYPELVRNTYVHSINNERWFCHLILESKLKYNGEITYPVKYFAYQQHVRNAISKLVEIL